MACVTACPAPKNNPNNQYRVTANSPIKVFTKEQTTISVKAGEVDTQGQQRDGEREGVCVGGWEVCGIILLSLSRLA